MVSILKGISSSANRRGEVETDSKKASEMALEDKMFNQLTYHTFF